MQHMGSQLRSSLTASTSGRSGPPPTPALTRIRPAAGGWAVHRRDGKHRVCTQVGLGLQGRPTLPSPTSCHTHTQQCYHALACTQQAVAEGLATVASTAAVIAAAGSSPDFLYNVMLDANDLVSCNLASKLTPPCK